jgi:tripartite-type tricarboxylate transporter receptor subunit TctC
MTSPCSPTQRPAGRFGRPGAMLAVLTLACAAASVAWAQAVATEGKPIEIIVPFPPGGSVDPVARVLQVGMKDPMGAPLVVVNQPGAGGTLGTARVARAVPNGLVLGLTTVGPLTTQPHLATLTYGVDSFEYICRTHVTPQVLAVAENSPFKSVKDLVEFAKKNPGKVSLSSTGIGSLPHLAALEFGQLAGFEWLHVPAKGDSDAAQLTLAGEITGWVAGVQTYVQAAPRLRALGILDAERNPALPDVPTFNEQGYALVSTGWGGLVAPKGTPAAVVSRLSQACAQATRSPEFTALLQTLKVPQGYQDAAGFAGFVRAESDRYGRLIRSLGPAQVKSN